MDGDQLELGEDTRLVLLRRAWDNSLHILSNKISKVTFESYIRTATPISYQENQVIIGTPSPFAREWFKKNISIIQLTLSGALGKNIEIILQIVPAQNRPEASQQNLNDKNKNKTNRNSDLYSSIQNNSGKTRANKPLTMDIPFLSFIEKYNFSNFIIGQSNRLAHASAFAVAQSPGSLYNPLFIYGGSGLGKTHLLHALGIAAHNLHPDFNIALVDGELFTQHYVSALRERKMEELRRFYRSIDLWLVDDMQSIAGRDQTREEFFHTFNALHQTGKQIVLASDRSPRELRTMDERLRSRFEWGLIADITPPELETRVAILEKRCEQENWDIPNDLLYYIASAIQSNIRALEGALIKLVACSSIMNQPFSIGLAQRVLKEYFIEKMPDSDNGKAIPVDVILKVAADHMNISMNDIISEKRVKAISNARQIAMYLARDLCSLSLAQIGAAMGKRNHTTVQRAIAKVEEALPYDDDLRKTISVIKSKIDREIN
jgi:chromosomal replication initiator protein